MAPDRDGHEADEHYFESQDKGTRVFDSRLLRESLDVLSTHKPLVFAGTDSVTDAMRGMQRERTGCVLITEDGTQATRLVGVFTERDVLFRIVDRGRNPMTLPLSEVMTPDPETLPNTASVARVLNQMAIGGFRHVPVVDAEMRPVYLVSVRDVVQFLVEFFPREVLTLPPPRRKFPPTREGA